MDSAEALDERSEWTIRLSSACQLLAGATIDADMARFRNALHEFAVAAVRVAARLEQADREQLPVSVLARDSSCSRTALLQGFRQAFGMSIHAYQTRVRVRHAIRTLQKVGSNVDAIARDVGYRSTKNLYARLSATTGLSPHAVRQMLQADVERVLETVLALPIARTRLVPTRLDRRSRASPSTAGN